MLEGSNSYVFSITRDSLVNPLSQVQIDIEWGGDNKEMLGQRSLLPRNVIGVPEGEKMDAQEQISNLYLWQTR